MGVQIKDLLVSETVTIEQLSGHRIAIDAFNTLYQFLSIIRQRDGTPLMDSHGQVTSHLSGLLYRTGKMMAHGIRPVFVFDGKPPSFKLVTKARAERRKEARDMWEQAKKKGDIETARKYAQQSSRLEQHMIDDSKKLLGLMGVPVVQAPSEGEAQAAVIVERGDAWAVGSQDFDALLFGTPKLLRNLTMSGRRKLPGKNVYVRVEPELIDLQQNLDNLGLTREQLIVAGILIGTDFNPGGFKGIGPKRALDIVKKKPSLSEAIQGFSWRAEWPKPDQIFEFFLKPPHKPDYKLDWKKPKQEKLVEFMVGKHSFSEDRVRKVAQDILSGLKKGKQIQLEQWF
ncbi:MAG: flap endonuclease-1 [Candidatus Altiarchaeota archaeon]|nr:flap endonuclease-1 [Candidatus Altiarchaeota archaeon]